MVLTKETVELLAILIPSMGGIFLWFERRSVRREKHAEKRRQLEIDIYKNEIRKQGDSRNQAFASINGAMWQALSDLRCDRIYIIQPHPTSEYPNMPYISITQEVKRDEVCEMMPNIQSMKISGVAAYVKKLATDEFFIYSDIENTKIDRRAKTIMQLSGTQSMAVHRLKSQEGHWIGNIVAEHTSAKCWECGMCQVHLTKLAKKIQMILPDYEGPINN